MMKRYSIFASIITILIVALIAMSANAKAGAINGMALCQNVIIPSLLPLLILTNTIINSKCNIVFKKIFKPFCKILKLPSCCGSIILFGLVAGYPSGAILTHNLYKCNAIDTKQAGRIMCFNFCGGAAFIITAVGSVRLGSIKYGLILYFANIISSLIIAVATSFGKSNKDGTAPLQYLTLDNALISSVNSSINSILNICAYIILFSAVSNLFNIPDIIKPVIEITNGVCAESSYNLEQIGAFLAFGGLCIHIQVYGMLKDMVISYFKFLFGRAAGALISYGVIKLYFLISGDTMPVFSNIANNISYKVPQVDIKISILMIIGCVIFILDLENKKIKLRPQ